MAVNDTTLSDVSVCAVGVLCVCVCVCLCVYCVCVCVCVYVCGHVCVIGPFHVFRMRLQ